MKNQIKLINEHITFLRWLDEEDFRDEIRQALRIKKNIYLNNELTDEEIQYIEKKIRTA
ncbi:hypothetical protein [Paramaledivibacter caminithermalis]|uniref:Uncharacterized protein n=1 Tax=Paramaledivibacter caminithermalis (strain DSM 15212 / CIP 107654 / DViRD3) TaxID=1121301 RepID=A0A1M6PEI0_PARC5|nr:hypothetical protein [Paramaledivibacter caminithermalis]SHK06292.1 hypothetical protein SAMN02745912_02133 [Paramaledivibacter caminithermalis DSM 15212]